MRLLVSAVSLAVAMVVAAAAGEAWLRLRGDAEPRPFTWVGDHADRPSENFLSDPEIGWKMRPGGFTSSFMGREIQYRADDAGFRIGADPASDDRRPRIVLVGDSQLWGFGLPYEESCGALLQEGLGGCEVVNLAMPGFGVDQIWLTLRHYGLARRPDLVVVGLFRDDFQRSLDAYRTSDGFNKPSFYLEGGELRRFTIRERPGRLRRWLENESRLWMAAKNLVRQQGRTLPFGTWWHLNAAFIDAIKEDCRAAGVPVLFVRVPHSDGLDFPVLEAHMSETGSAYVDPARHSGSDSYYFPDGHLNAEGNRWLADSIHEWIAGEMPQLASR